MDLVKANPGMIMQLMGSDPRWMEVFKVMTGVDLGSLSEQK
jgi:hypothetical protein